MWTWRIWRINSSRTFPRLFSYKSILESFKTDIADSSLYFWFYAYFLHRVFLQMLQPAVYIYISRIRQAPVWLRCFLWGETLNQSISKLVLCHTGSWWRSWFEPYRSHFFICTGVWNQAPFQWAHVKEQDLTYNIELKQIHTERFQKIYLFSLWVIFH